MGKVIAMKMQQKQPQPNSGTETKTTADVGTDALAKALLELQNAKPGVKPEAQRGSFVVSFDVGKNATGST